VLVCVDAEPEPHRWTSAPDDMQTVESEMAVEIAEEPPRPLVSDQEAA
jgi:hypothetical protein